MIVQVFRLIAFINFSQKPPGKLKVLKIEVS